MSVSKERIETNTPAIELERAPAELVLCLCHGNVLRSQWAEFLLELLGINATSAALGDISKQHYQDVVPLHIIALMNEYFHIYGPLRGKIIKGIDEATYRQSSHVLVFDDPKHLSDHMFIDPNDLRIRLITTQDPFGKISSYDDVLLEIANSVIIFVRENFPDKLPDLLKNKKELNSLLDLSYVLRERIVEWTERNRKLTFDHRERYAISSGQNALGLIDTTLNWVLRRKNNDFMGGIEHLYPSLEQCQEIIFAIESSDYERLSQLIQERIVYIESQYRIIQQELSGTNGISGYPYHMRLEREKDIILTLRSNYNAFLRYIQAHRK